MITGRDHIYNNTPGSINPLGRIISLWEDGVQPSPENILDDGYIDFEIDLITRQQNFDIDVRYFDFMYPDNSTDEILSYLNCRTVSGACDPYTHDNTMTNIFHSRDLLMTCAREYTYAPFYAGTTFRDMCGGG